MSWLHLDMQSAVASATGLLLLAAALRPVRSRWSAWVAAASFETALVCSLFALWQFANAVTHTHVAGGLANGHAVWDAERWLHLPDELDVQRLVLGHPGVVRASNYYYATAHLTGMVVFLVWLWLRHRDRYRQWRNVVVGFTAASLLIQVVPVAPPRLIDGTGLIDTAMVYGQSVYAAIGGNLADQYAAMPSIHVGWAVLIAVAVVSVSPSRWRWLAVGHAAATVFVVVATANHYWLDGVVAVAVLALAWWAERLLHGALRRLRTARATGPGRAGVPAWEPATGSVSPATVATRVASSNADSS